jgi:putative SOS response-associated peptidase YedK
MCGRFNYRLTPAQLQEVFETLRIPDADWTPRYNIAPTQPIVAIRQAADGREAVMMRWGLIPHWASAPAGPPNINARSETISTKPMFRDAFAKRRCLIPASGFYEWKQTGRKQKEPYHVQLKGGRPCAFAGLWDHWGHGDGRIESCTIITTDANDLLRPLHDRMPVFLHKADYATWLDPDNDDPDELQSLLVPFPSEEMEAYPVSSVVNNAKNETPECIEPAENQRTLF